MSFTAWFDRDLGEIHGAFTLQSARPGHAVEEIFKRLPATSGQRGYTDGGMEDWIVGKGPIPMGEYWLSTKREKLFMAPVGTPFYVIADKKGERTIKGPGGVVRYPIGLHLENSAPGTAGCIALLHDTQTRRNKAWAVFDYLDKLNARGIPYIRLTVL